MFFGVGTPGGKPLILEIQGWVAFILFGDSEVPALAPPHHPILSPLKNLMSEFPWQKQCTPKGSRDPHSMYYSWLCKLS